MAAKATTPSAILTHHHGGAFTPQTPRNAQTNSSGGRRDQANLKRRNVRLLHHAYGSVACTAKQLPGDAMFVDILQDPHGKVGRLHLARQPSRDVRGHASGTHNTVMSYEREVTGVAKG
jgi:hypothetical protein